MSVISRSAASGEFGNMQACLTGSARVPRTVLKPATGRRLVCRKISFDAVVLSNGFLLQAAFSCYFANHGLSTVLVSGTDRVSPQNSNPVLGLASGKIYFKQVSAWRTFLYITLLKRQIRLNCNGFPLANRLPGAGRSPAGQVRCNGPSAENKRKEVRRNVKSQLGIPVDPGPSLG